MLPPSCHHASSICVELTRYKTLLLSAFECTVCCVPTGSRARDFLAFIGYAARLSRVDIDRDAQASLAHHRSNSIRRWGNPIHPAIACNSAPCHDKTCAVQSMLPNLQRRGDKCSSGMSFLQGFPSLPAPPKPDERFTRKVCMVAPPDSAEGTMTSLCTGHGPMLWAQRLWTCNLKLGIQLLTFQSVQSVQQCALHMGQSASIPMLLKLCKQP